MGVIDGRGLRGSGQGAWELMILNLKLLDSMVGSQRTLAPNVPTALDFFASIS
jgi:hypothetical protein